MEIKKTPKADLENRRTLYTEIGLVVALLVVWGAFSYSTKEKAVASLGEDTQVVEVEDMVPITQETPPPPPEAPKIPVLSDQIDIVEDDIKVEDNFMSLEDDANLGVEIMDYVEEVKEEVVEEEAIPFQLVEEKLHSTVETPMSSQSGLTPNFSTRRSRRRMVFKDVLPFSSPLILTVP